LKLGLERAVLSQQRENNGEGGGEGGDENNTGKKDKSDRVAQAKEIDELLKKGAYDVFRDDDDGEAEKFMETDIDQLLERSSKKVTYDASATSSLGSSGLGSFSKASFVASTGDGEKDVDLDDPDFWKKAVGLDAPEEITEEEAAMLHAGVKRSRKQVQVFDPYSEFAEAEQRKQDKIESKIKEEKQEKERLRLEKKQRKKEDQKALDQLKSVGNVNEARYRFISESFMERHELGPYNVAFSEIELDLGSSKEASISKENDGTEDGAGSDSGWILDALGVEEEDNSSSSVPFDTSIGVSMGSGGPQVSVGVGVTIGKKKKRSSSQKLRNVIEGSSSNGISSKRKKPMKPHLSDSESGIMGRLRASGANSLVGRSILGAYPGDLPSPDEAADSRGVAYMARRYGYGDWSDEEDESDENPLDGDASDDDAGSLVENLTKQERVRPKKRSKTGTKAKKRRSSSSRTSASTLAVSSSVSGSISTSASRRRRKTRRSQLPSLAMQTLGEKPGSGSAASKSRSTSTSTKKASQSSDANIKDALLGSTKRKKPVRPAMSILDETKKSSSSTNAKSQNEDL